MYFIFKKCLYNKKMTRPKHLYIDLSYVFHRYLHGVKGDILQAQKMNKENSEDPDYEQMDSFATLRYSCLNHIFDLIGDHKPDEVVLACDHKISWRKKYFEAYKAHRKATRDKDELDYKTFYTFIDDFISEMSVYMPFMTLQLKNLEGDDIVAHMVKKNYRKCDIVFVTADQDYYQLLQYDNVVMYEPRKRIIIEKTRAEALNDLQIKILMGDKSDNIPACRPLLGLKTAEKLLLGEKWKAKTLDEYMEDDDFIKNYKRNTHLVDMNHCPSKLLERLDKQIDDYEFVNTKLIYEYFKTKKIRSFLQRITQIGKMLRKIVKYHENGNISCDKDITELFS